MAAKQAWEDIKVAAKQEWEDTKVVAKQKWETVNEIKDKFLIWIGIKR